MSDELKALLVCICGFCIFIGLLVVGEYSTGKQKSECVIESQKIGKLTMLEIKELCK